MYFLLYLSYYGKSYGHFSQILAYFTMPAHVTQEANSENYFCPNSTFNIRKSHKISSGKALYLRRYQPKSSRGCFSLPPPPPVPLGLKNHTGIIKGSNCNQVSILKGSHHDLDTITVG